MGLKLVTAATAKPVTLDQVKAQAGIESSDWDTLLGLYLDAATQMVEEWCSGSLCAQVWELVLPCFPETITLDRGPVTSVQTITYSKPDGTTATLAVSDYLTDLTTYPAAILPALDHAWPATQAVPEAVTVRFATGFADVPAAIKLAITITAAAWFATREIGNLPAGVMQMLEPWRQGWVFA
ncbi:UNVERIFIED_ORG: putative phiE125 gp8 family phage protein [Sphingomonas sp. R1F5B]